MTPAPLSTINDLILRVAGAANSRAILWQDEFNNWQPLSSDQIYCRVHQLAEAFLSWGAKKGDRIALISENRWEWVVTDFAILSIGAVNVPIYPTLTGDQIAVLLADAGCRIAVVSTRQQFDKLNAVRSHTQLEHILMMDPGHPEGAVAFSKTLAGADDPGSYRDPVFDALIRSVQPADLATLIYTSGTTGEPKGVMLTHGNIASNQNLAVNGYAFNETDSCISFLPLSHITARALDYVMYGHGSQVVYCSNFDRLPQAMKEIRPTVFVGVPRVYEKIRQAVEQKSSASPIKKRLLAWALKTGSHHSDTVYDGRQPSSLAWKLANKLVYAKVREAFGGRVRVWVSGGAPLGVDTARWFASAGIAVWEGYGLTETSPVIALNNPQVHRMGAVGKTLPNVELKLAEDGELLVRGPSIFVGYWNKPEANSECFDAEGWFRTGDIAKIDDDGFLYITDRKKELLKTSGGKLVAPQPIENKLKNSVMVGQAALVGDKHKFISALISPNFAALEGWAKHAGLEAADRKALVLDSRVVALYGEVVREANSGLANFETVKRFRLVADEWSQDSGELTPSMKLKRRVINAKYAAEIAELYADEATARAE
ncbi:AMP-dependent synthetase/ligase [Occallatibacter savannae]|uniref:AMP-dependent synthetase/ligase n=1 Tax=Occallatibacter savannae TaxID=1002691 RepID=UPI000D686314|nr:long-chain fatty acid--CoA ligase [Occallatibacter savannae]